MKKLCMLLAIIILGLSVVANDIEKVVMSTGDIVILVGIAVFAITLFVVWCYCEAASRGDEIMRRK